MNYKIFSAILILALASMACGITFQSPIKPATPGAEVTEPITVPVPTSGERRLSLSFAAGEMKLSPGAKTNLVEGTATYNYAELKPMIKTEGNNVSIQTGDESVRTFPSFGNLKNEWDLKLSSTPMDLTIEAGAYSAEYEFGGLALTGLTVKDGAATVKASFSQPNKAEMAVLRYETGASNVALSGLSNANFTSLTFKSGAGDYTLDFSGELKKDATVTIETGLSNLILTIPEGLNARVTMEESVANVNVGRGWEKDGNTYTQSGSGPTLTFIVKIGAGNVSLTR